jgi:hypothetical protein
MGRKMNVRVLWILILLVAGTSASYAQKIRAEVDAESAHALKLVKTERKLPTQIETDGAGKRSFAASPDGKFKAYVLCVAAESTETDNCSGRVFVENTETKEIYEVRGEELFVEVGRPVDELKWKNAYTLTYERWVGPHFGHRYVIDVRTMEQTTAYVLTDQ